MKSFSEMAQECQLTEEIVDQAVTSSHKQEAQAECLASDSKSDLTSVQEMQAGDELNLLKKIPVRHGVPKIAHEAWMKTLEETGSPAAALKAAKDTGLNGRLVYMPHQGRKEREKRLRKMEKMKQKELANG